MLQKPANIKISAQLISVKKKSGKKKGGGGEWLEVILPISGLMGFRNGHLSLTIICTLQTCTSTSNTEELPLSPLQGDYHTRQHEEQNAPHNTKLYGQVRILRSNCWKKQSRLRFETLLSGFSFQATDLLSCSLTD